MSGKHKSFLIFLLFIMSAVFLLYPTISLELNKLHATTVMTDYDDKVFSMSSDQYIALEASAREYNELIKKEDNRFVPSEGMHERYMKELVVDGTDVIGSIEIPSINMTSPIYHTTEEKVLQVGVGHIEGTSLLVGGLGTHCVLAGHRGLKTNELFTNIDKLVEGDHFIIKYLDETMTYEVTKIQIVLPSDSNRNLLIDENKDQVTLVSCTPLGINTHRYLVTGERVENDVEEDAPHSTFNINYLVALIMILIYILTVVIVLLIDRHKRMKQ